MQGAVSAAPPSSDRPSIFSLSQLQFLVLCEEVARGSPEVIRAYELAEQYLFLDFQLTDYHGLIPSHERTLASWMEVTSAIQLALVRRALLAWPVLQAWPATTGDGTAPAFDASPAALLTDGLPGEAAVAILGSLPQLPAPASMAAAAALPRVALSRALWELRTVGGGRFPELSAQLRSHRHNRARRGALRPGDAAPDAALHTVPDGRRCSLLELVAAAAPLPLVVLTGSYS